MKTRVLIGVVVLLAAVAAYAAVTWHSGPSFSIADFNLEAQGSVSGLGTRATAQLFATGTGNGSCQNPGSKFPAPFNNVPISASGQSVIAPERSGASDVDVTVVATPGNPCPNPHWSVVFTSVTYTNARILISNKNGVLLDQSYTLGTNGDDCTATSPTGDDASCGSTP
jgi:hypothetical protein